MILAAEQETSFRQTPHPHPPPVSAQLCRPPWGGAFRCFISQKSPVCVDVREEKLSVAKANVNMQSNKVQLDFTAFVLTGRFSGLPGFSGVQLGGRTCKLWTNAEPQLRVMQWNVCRPSKMWCLENGSRALVTDVFVWSEEMIGFSLRAQRHAEAGASLRFYATKENGVLFILNIHTKIWNLCAFFL